MFRVKRKYKNCCIFIRFSLFLCIFAAKTANNYAKRSLFTSHLSPFTGKALPALVLLHHTHLDSIPHAYLPGDTIRQRSLHRQMDTPRHVWRHLLRHLVRIPPQPQQPRLRETVLLRLPATHPHERTPRTPAGLLHRRPPQWRLA